MRLCPLLYNSRKLSNHSFGNGFVSNHLLCWAIPHFSCSLALQPHECNGIEYQFSLFWHVLLDLICDAGYGKSRSGQVSDPVIFLTHLISSLKLPDPVIVSPSMSGFISLPFLTAHPEKVKGYIPVAPVSTGKYKALYPSVKVSFTISFRDRRMRQNLTPHLCVICECEIL